MAAYADITNHGAVESTSSSPSSAILDANRDAWQAAIDLVMANGGGIVHAPPGATFPMSKRTGTGAQSLSSVRIDGKGAGIKLLIDAPATVIRQSGAGSGSSGDWYGFDIRNSAEVTFRGGKSSQRDVSSSGEQTHMFSIGDGTTDVNKVKFQDWDFVEGVGGDGIRCVGGTSGEVSLLTVLDCTFDGCDRSGISVQRGVRKVTVLGSRFKNTGDQDIDFEPTSDGFIGEFNIQGNDFIRSAGSTNNAVTLSGYGGTYYSDKNRFIGNFLDGGCINSGNLYNTIIANNYIAVDKGADPLIYLFRRGQGVKILHNHLIRGVNASAGQVIYVTQNNSYAPERVLIQGNTIEQNTLHNGVELEGVRHWKFLDNNLDVNLGTANTYYGVKSRALFQSISGEFRGNTVRGINAALKAAVMFSPYSDTNIVDYAECTNNTILNSQYEADYGTSGITRYGTLPFHCNNTASNTVARFTGISAVRTGAASFLSSASPNGVITGRRGDICQRTDTAGMWYCSADGTTWGQWH